MALRSGTGGSERRGKPGVPASRAPSERMAKASAKPEAKKPDAEKPKKEPASPVPPEQRWKRLSMGLAAGCVLLIAASSYLAFGGAAAASAKGEGTGPDAKSGGGAPGAGPSASGGNKDGGKVERGNILNGYPGLQITGCVNPQFLCDGNSDQFDGGNNYTYHDMNDPNSAMILTFPKPVELSKVRFRLWDQDDRFYHYVLSASPDGKAWKVVKDNTKIDSKSWQEITFGPQKVLVLKLRGMPAASAGANYLHVVEFEGYSSAAMAQRRIPPKDVSVSQGQLKPGLWGEFYDDLGSYPAAEDMPTLALPITRLDFGTLTQPLATWPLQGRVAAIISGFVKIEQEGTYKFFVTADDAANLYIDGIPVVKQGYPWGEADLKPGLHRIWVEYYNANGPMALNIHYRAQGDSEGSIPPELLFYDPREARHP